MVFGVLPNKKYFDAYKKCPPIDAWTSQLKIFEDES